MWSLGLKLTILVSLGKVEQLWKMITLLVAGVMLIVLLFSTWEISSDRFYLGEHWQEYVDSLMKMACVDLGVRGDGIRAELYKMLLYREGAMFKRHSDSEEVPGIFGTLVISLPSAHWDGAVVVSRNGQRYSLKTHDHECLAW